MFDEIDTRNVAQHEPEPFWAFGCNDKYVSGAHAIQGRYPHFMEVGAQLSKQDFTFVECELIGLFAVSSG